MNMNDYPDSYKFPLLWNNRSEDTVKMYFPDLPGCEFSVPKNFRVTDALERASITLASHLYQMEKDKKTIPKPTPLYKLAKEPGTGIYVIAAMTKYRDPVSRKKEKQPVVTQLSILDFSNQKVVEQLNKEKTEQVPLNTFHRKSCKAPGINGAEISPTENPPTGLPSINIPPYPPSKNISQLELWKALIICILVILIGGGIINLNKNAGSYKPSEIDYSQRPAAASIVNTK